MLFRKHSIKSVSSFFLELFLHWSPVVHWAPTDLRSSSFSVLSFCLFMLFLGFSRQEYWSALPFLSPVDHVLSELSTMSCPSWVASHGMTHSFIELDKAVVHVISLVGFLCCCFHSVCPPMDKDKRLVEASWWERLLRSKLGLVLMGGTMDSKPLIQFSAEGRNIIKKHYQETLSPNYSGDNEDNHFSSVTQSCPTLCNPMNCSTPGLPVYHQLMEFIQTHVHCVGDVIQPSHPLSSPSPPVLNLFQHQGLFQWVSSSYQVAKVLEFQLQHQSFQWTPRTDRL